MERKEGEKSTESNHDRVTVTSLTHAKKNIHMLLGLHRHTDHGSATCHVQKSSGDVGYNFSVRRLLPGIHLTVTGNKQYKTTPSVSCSPCLKRFFCW